MIAIVIPRVVVVPNLDRRRNPSKFYFRKSLCIFFFILIQRTTSKCDRAMGSQPGAERIRQANFFLASGSYEKMRNKILPSNSSWI